MLRTGRSLRASLVAMVVVAGIGAVFALARSGNAFAAAANPQAESLNDEGKSLFKAGDLQGAAAKFRQALALSADARFDYNLCAALEKLADYDAALEACDAVFHHGGDSDLRAKAGTRSASIREARRKAHTTPPGNVVLPPPPEGYPDGTPPPPGAKPQMSPVVMTAEPTGKAWALGFDFGPVFSGNLVHAPRLGPDQPLRPTSKERLYGDIPLTVAGKLRLRPFVAIVNRSDSDGEFERTFSSTTPGVAVAVDLHLTGILSLSIDLGVGTTFATFSVDDPFGDGMFSTGDTKETWLNIPASIGIEAAFSQRFAFRVSFGNDLYVPLASRSKVLHGGVGDITTLMFALEIRFPLYGPTHPVGVDLQ